MPGAPLSCTASASRNSALRPPRPAAAHGDRGLAAGQQHAGRCRRLAVAARLERDRRPAPWRPRAPRPRSHRRGSAASRPRSLRDRRGRLERGLRPGDDDRLGAARGAGRRAWASPRRRPRRCSSTAGRRLDADSARGCASASAKVEGSGTVGPEPITAGSSPGTSEISRLTTRAGWRRGREPAALDRREVLAHDVHLADVGARGEQRAVDRLLVLEASAPAPAGQAAPRRRPRSGRAPDRPARRRAASSRIRAGGVQAGGIGHRMRRLDDLDPRAGGAVAVAGHDQALERARPCGARPPGPWPPRPCRRRARSSGRAAARAGAAGSPAPAWPPRARPRAARAAEPRPG